jgi:hypothetical protein
LRWAGAARVLGRGDLVEGPAVGRRRGTPSGSSTMSISSAPAATARRMSSSRTSRALCPAGTPRRRSPPTPGAGERRRPPPPPAPGRRTPRPPTGRSILRDRGASPWRTGPDLARRVGALERGEVHAADRQIERGALVSLLDRPPGEGGGPLLETDRVDGGMRTGTLPPPAAMRAHGGGSPGCCGRAPGRRRCLRRFAARQNGRTGDGRGMSRCAPSSSTTPSSWSASPACATRPPSARVPPEPGGAHDRSSSTRRRSPTTRIEVDTPLAPAPGGAGRRPPLIVPVMRAGLGMLHAAKTCCRTPGWASWACAATRRRTSPRVREHRARRIWGAAVLVLDPMLATGGSLVNTCELLVERTPAHHRRLRARRTGGHGAVRAGVRRLGVDGLDRRATQRAGRSSCPVSAMPATASSASPEPPRGATHPPVLIPSGV